MLSHPLRVIETSRKRPTGEHQCLNPQVRCGRRNGMGKGGGCILAPCANIQANTPPENVVGMYEKGYEQGWERF